MNGAAGLVPIVAGGAGALLLLAALGWALLTYNRLVRQRNQVAASWAHVDVALRRRHDLVPNLVEVVRGYAAHERTVLHDAMAARAQAMHAAGADPAGRATAETHLSAAVGRLFALAEAYPRLRADGNFAQLHEELTGTENRVAHARQFYNSAVQTLTNTVQAVPSNVIARLCGFRAPRYFEAIGPERDRIHLRH